MDIQTEIRGSAVLARLSGEIDLAAADTLRNSLEVEMENNSWVRNLIINFGGVTYIDSSGLGVLLGRYRKVIKKGGNVFIVGAVPQVRKILEMSGLLRVMPECSSEAEALKRAG